MSGGQLPKRPVLGWSSFAGRRSAGEAGVLDLPSQALVTSGRAALYHALRQLDLRPGTAVLVPTYHCPTMIAPVVCAKLQPVFYGIGEDGLPLVSSLERAATRTPKAMIVAHFFGLPQSLRAVREYCDAHGIALIEDCAHALFGMAGDRPVGAWGDFAAASLTKFLPVAELGLLARNGGAFTNPLENAGLLAEFKALVDVLERAASAGRPAGLAPLLNVAMRLKNRITRARDAELNSTLDRAVQDADSPYSIVGDMGRIFARPGGVNTLLMRALPRRRIVHLRRKIFDSLAAELRDLPGSRALVSERPPSAAPYAFPLWVAEADKSYNLLRHQGWPIFRWDQTWPGAAEVPGDAGVGWRRHVLQILCHQDISDLQAAQMALAVRDSLR